MRVEKTKSTPPPEAEQQGAKKHHRFRNTIIILLIFIVVVPVLFFGWFGFIPFLSDVLGANRPVDLGAPYTEQDRIDVNEKFGQKFVEGDTALLDVLESGGAVAVSESFTQEQVAAHVEETHPVRDVQVLLNDDGSFAASGRIDASRVSGIVRAMGLSTPDTVEVLDLINKWLKSDPSFYFVGQGSVTDDAASVNLTEAKIGRFSVPVDVAGGALADYANAVMEAVPHFDADAITITNGQLRYEGTAAATVPVY